MTSGIRQIRPLRDIFLEYDFIKAMKGNGLCKWDGTVKDYPLF